VVVTADGAEILTLLESDAARAKQLLAAGRAMSPAPVRT
jgi:hypothetical protein